MPGRAKGGLMTDATFLVGGMLAAVVARKVLSVVWVAASGKAVPDDPGDPRVSTGEALTFAVLSGAAVGVARVLVQRKANRVKEAKAARALGGTAAGQPDRGRTSGRELTAAGVALA